MLKRTYPQRRKRKKEPQNQKELPIFKASEKKGTGNRNISSSLIFPEKKIEYFRVFIYFSRTTKVKSNGNSNEIAMEMAFKTVIETALKQTFLFYRTLTQPFISLSIKVLYSLSLLILSKYEKFGQIF